MGGKPKLSYEFVRQFFENRGCKLLETEYTNHSTPLRYIATCGHEHRISFDNFSKGKGDLCKRCRYDRIQKQQRLGYEAIKAYFESEGCTVLNTDFQKNTDPVHYIARCGHENVLDYSHFFGQKAGRVCNKCSKSIRYDYDTVKGFFAEQGCTLLEPEYKNCKTSMRYIAKCGHEARIDLDHFLNSKNYHKLCLSCLSDEVKAGRIQSVRHCPEMREWRDTVFARDRFACQVCGEKGGELNAHHLDCYALFPEKSLDVDNGVTLCANCHRTFHSFVGPKTTKKDFVVFKGIVDSASGNTEVTEENKSSSAP